MRALWSALTIAISYILGGLVPLSPYMFFPVATDALAASVVITLVALMGFGFAKGYFTGSKPFISALQTTFIGAVASAAAYSIAKLFQAWNRQLYIIRFLDFINVWIVLPIYFLSHGNMNLRYCVDWHIELDLLPKLQGDLEQLSLNARALLRYFILNMFKCGYKLQGDKIKFQINFFFFLLITN